MPQPSRGYADLVKHRGYASLLTAQALSVFNDNAFKYVLSLVVMARAATMAGQNRLIAFASALFVLPYILFSTYAGQAADRYSKRSVIVTLKLLEVALMAAGALAIFTGDIRFMLAVLFLEGTHSAFLAPAKEGILPQMLGDADLSRANPSGITPRQLPASISVMGRPRLLHNPRQHALFENTGFVTGTNGPLRCLSDPTMMQSLVANGLSRGTGWVVGHSRDPNS
ncbi:MAG: hypothetical protein DMG26_10555 [Acidobacteria bacterium]|nr:MAG: hypothetical protein DMG26_10555 [Acidobacteriota bacterium]